MISAWKSEAEVLFVIFTPAGASTANLSWLTYVGYDKQSVICQWIVM